MVELRKISKENYESVLALRVSEAQRGFVPTVTEALAQAWVYYDTAYPFAVYAEGAPVGFIMLGYYEARNQYTLWKFMIDHHWQGMGIGRQALPLGIAFLKETFGAREIYTGVVPENKAAAHLYEALGFRDTGLCENGMKEMKLIC